VLCCSSIQGKGKKCWVKEEENRGIWRSGGRGESIPQRTCFAAREGPRSEGGGPDQVVSVAAAQKEKRKSMVSAAKALGLQRLTSAKGQYVNQNTASTHWERGAKQGAPATSSILRIWGESRCRTLRATLISKEGKKKSSGSRGNRKGGHENCAVTGEKRRIPALRADVPGLPKGVR